MGGRDCGLLKGQKLGHEANEYLCQFLIITGELRPNQNEK